MRFAAGLPLLLSFVIGCGLVLDLDPPPDGALPDGAVPDARLVDGQTPDAGDDAPIFDGGLCVMSEDCGSTLECIIDCVSGRCMQRLNDDGVCACQDGAEITRPLRGGCGSVLRTCTDGVFTDATFPAEEVCGVDDTCDRGPTLYPAASCGVGACRRPSSGCEPTCFVELADPSRTDGCTPESEAPIDDDCDGRIDEDCVDALECDHVFDGDTSEVDIGEGINCFLAPADGACSPITFQSASDLPEGNATLIGNLYRGPSGIRRCTAVAGGRFSSTTLNTRDGWRAQSGTEIRIQDMMVTTGTVPAIESIEASLHLHGVVMNGAIHADGGQLEITGSKVTSNAGDTIETSDTDVDIAGSCDNRPSGRCALPVVGSLGFLGIFNTGTGAALRAQGGTLRMDASYVSVVSGQSMRLDAMNTFAINGSAIVAGTSNGSGDSVNIDVDGCSTRSSIRESIVVTDGNSTGRARFTGVRSVDCSLLLTGTGDEELSGPNPRIVGLSSGSGQSAIGLDCGGSGGCTVRDLPIAGFAGSAIPAGESSGVGVRCETFCSLTNVASAGNVSEARSAAATGAEISGTAIIHRSTLLGGNSPTATGLFGDQITIQDSLAVGFGRRLTDVAGAAKGIGVYASNLNALQCTFAGRVQGFDAASIPLPTCDGAVLFGGPSVLVSTITTAGLCDNPIGVYVETGDPMPSMSHVAFGPTDRYVGTDGLDVEPLDSPPFHSVVVRFRADAFTPPGTVEVGYNPNGRSALAGGGNPELATPVDRRGTPRPIPPAIGALEPTP